MEIAIAIIIMVLAICEYVSMAEIMNTYIVHMEKSQMPASFTDHTDWYHSSLKSVSQSADMLYTYNHVIHGFSTSLTPHEARRMEARHDVLSVFPELIYEPQTTQTPFFLHLNDISSNTLQPTSNIVIGVLDTGVWPESPSFNDKGIGTIPNSWKGECETGPNFTRFMCNNKLVGARYFLKGYQEVLHRAGLEFVEEKSPRDKNGHGTHTLTTSAGSIVTNASLFGYANGTARGMVTQARVAAYKVCWIHGCVSSDVLAGMDKAMDDNVDVISVSIGGTNPNMAYYSNPFSIGAFAAMEKGIFVSCAAGNNGPTKSILFNSEPWVTTVGAGTLDREFSANVKLGNGKIYKGASLYEGSSLLGLVPFVYAATASNASSNGSYCIPGTLDPRRVEGKIVLCDRGINPRTEKASVVKEAGGVGMVLANNVASGEELVADAYLYPATIVGFSAASKMKKYLGSVRNPMATIVFEGMQLGVHPSPVVAAFSSRGPNPVSQNILKPDIIAPGVNILAAWTGAAGPTGLVDDKREVLFNIISGTSMACPHVSGLAGMLKAVHPEWNPAAIRSALMTTAYSTDEDGKPILDASTMTASTPFDHGAGHVNPVAALDPGLVYNLNLSDYLDFLCASNYTRQQIKTLAKRDFVCNANKSYNVNDLNYPSFAVALRASNHREFLFKRKLTNVALPSTYKVSISSTTNNSAVKIIVAPQKLTFCQKNETLSYTVTFDATSLPQNSEAFGDIMWYNEKHVVKTPYAITWN